MAVIWNYRSHFVLSVLYKIVRLSGNPRSLMVSLVFHVRRAFPFPCTQATTHHASHHSLWVLWVSSTCQNAICLFVVCSNGMAIAVGLRQSNVRGRTVAGFTVSRILRFKAANCPITFQVHMLSVCKNAVVT